MKAYYYFYYKLFKFSKWSPSIFPSDFNAVALLNGLEIAFVASLCFLIEIINKQYTEDVIFLMELGLPSIFIVVFNAVTFSKRNKNLTECMESFESWPKRKNTIGTFVIVAMVLFITLLCYVTADLSGKYNVLNN